MSQPKRICVIDDDVFVLDAVMDGLNRSGYTVVSAPGAAAGLDLVARTGADAIVTDMNMPGTSGAQLIVEARARWPHMPIIAISGSMTAEGASMLDIARDLGADALVRKPFRASELVLLINQAFAEKRTSAEAEAEPASRRLSLFTRRDDAPGEA